MTMSGEMLEGRVGLTKIINANVNVLYGTLSLKH